MLLDPHATPPDEGGGKKQKGKTSKRVLKPAPTPSPSRLSELDIFSKVKKKHFQELVSHCEGLVLQRDTRLSTSIDEPQVLILLTGQICLCDDGEALRAAEKKRRKKELFKATEKTHALFGSGDVIWPSHIETSEALALITITECDAIQIPLAVFEKFLAGSSAFKSALRSRIENWLSVFDGLKNDSRRADIFDFYLKNGFSYSTRTKIRQLELCIDCDKCVEGCEERHGFSRLERFGPEVGLVNFSVSCRQCYDPRCLTECNFDAIARDPISKEIRIVMDRCTGCSVCARNCPNDSIFIHPLTEDIDKSLWEEQGKRAPKKTAVKCDRCAGYDDMACISACPTGSMIDIEPKDIFSLLESSPRPVMSEAPFESGVSEERERKSFAPFIYAIAAMVFGALFLEWLSREHFGNILWLKAYAEDLAPSTSGRRVVPYKGFGYALGVGGAICLASTLLYVFRKRMPRLFFWLGPTRMWYILHNALGGLAPGLLVLHASFHFNQWPALGVIAGLALVVTGWLGQYLSSRLPGQEYVHQRERDSMNGLLQEMSKDWGEHTRSVNLAEVMLTLERDKEARKAKEMSVIATLGRFIRDDFAQRRQLVRIRFGPLRSIRNRKLRAQMLRVYRDKLTLDRFERYHQRLAPIVNAWRKVHIFFAIGFVFVSFLHVAFILWDEFAS